MPFEDTATPHLLNSDSNNNMADARNCETAVTASCTLEPWNESLYCILKIRSNYGDIVESKIMRNFSLSFDLMEITKNNWSYECEIGQ